MAAIPAPVDRPDVRRASPGIRLAPRPPVVNDAPAPYLTRPALDTWLAGGLSLVVLAIVAVLSPLAGSVPSIGNQLRNLALIAPTLSLFINYPHFLASYRLAYRQRDSVVRHAFTLLFVPIALTAAVTVAFVTYNSNITLLGTTIDAFGSRLAGWIIELMFLTVGWHYVKQAYGCARVGARLRKYPMGAVDARVLRYALFPLWVAVWVRANASTGSFDFSGVTYGSLHLPHWLVPLSNVAIAAGALAVVAVLVGMQRRNERRPPLLMAVPLLAMFAWWIPATFNPTFWVLVPMFHSLQYLPFAYKVERGRIGAREPNPSRARRRLVVTAIAVGVAGWVVFEIAPDIIDRVTHAPAQTGVLFFAAMIPAFVNIHHYFIDHVIWRSTEPEVFSHLLAAPNAASERSR